MLDVTGQRLLWRRIENAALNLADASAAAGGPRRGGGDGGDVRLVLGGGRDRRVGARLHLAHPLGIAGYENRRVKNDIPDASPMCRLPDQALRAAGFGSPRIWR
jgi:hypothetical protein